MHRGRYSDPSEPLSVMFHPPPFQIPLGEDSTSDYARRSLWHRISNPLTASHCIVRRNVPRGAVRD